MSNTKPLNLLVNNRMGIYSVLRRISRDHTMEMYVKFDLFFRFVCKSRVIAGHNSLLRRVRSIRVPDGIMF